VLPRPLARFMGPTSKAGVRNGRGRVRRGGVKNGMNGVNGTHWSNGGRGG